MGSIIAGESSPGHYVGAVRDATVLLVNEPHESGDGKSLSPVSLETPTRLSESMIWEVQRVYWEERGPIAWSSGDVPFLLSTAPVVGRSYARLIEAFVEDAAAGRLGPIDPSEPVYVLDIGCGNGRLGYYVLRALDHDYLAPLRIVYVFADRARANIEFCESHPKLAPFFSAGQADIAQYDAVRDDALVLEKLGVTLEPGRVSNPVVAIGNYLLCVLPPDVISVIDGRIYEEHVEVIAEDESVRPADETFFDDIFVARYHVPFEPSRYGETTAAVVEKVAAERGNDHQFLLPIDWFNVYERVQQLSGHRSMVIVGDRPELTLPSPPAAVNPLPVPGKEVELQAVRPADCYGVRTHGRSISVPVDYGVVEAATELAGGSVFHTPHFAPAIRIGVMVEGEQEQAKVVRKRFQDSAVDPAPDDIWYTAQLTAVEDAPLEGLIAELRLACYDSDIFMKVYNGLEQLLREASGRIREETLLTLERVHDMDYRVTPTEDIAFGIGLLLAKAGLYNDALGFFDKSKETFGPRAQTSFNGAICYLNIGDNATGLALLNEAIELDPAYKLALSIRQKVLDGETVE
jgi:tetratricopeptide (TPR) repeat protein